MTEIKKDTNNNDSVKQLGVYKASKLNELNSEISREKTRATVLMTAIRAKREMLVFENEENEKQNGSEEAIVVKKSETAESAANVELPASPVVPPKIVERDTEPKTEAAAKAKDIADTVAAPKTDDKTAQAADEAEGGAAKKLENAQVEKGSAKDKAIDDTKQNANNSAIAGGAKTDKAENVPSEKPQQKDGKAAKSDKATSAERAADGRTPNTERVAKTENQIKADKAAKPQPKAEPKIEIRKSADYENVQEEVLPNGEIRRIYVPPTPVAKPKVQTRVFGQNGYNNGRPPRPSAGAPYAGGGYQGNNPSGGYQGNNPGGGYQGNRPNNGPGGYQGGGYQGNRPNNGPGGYQGSRPQNGFTAPPPQFPPQKGAIVKKPMVKPGGAPGNAKFDDHSALNKRALLKKGYIVEDNFGMDDESVRIRNLKNAKSRGGNSGGPIIIESAYVTTDPVSIKTLSEKIGKTAVEIIKILFVMGIIKTINENIDFATAELVASELKITLEYKPDVTLEETLTAKRVFDDEDESDKLVARPPVVTIMGHVDHGKTSLLDYIRKAHVTSGEAGGITQHIGAYTISLNGMPITFLDTPGHEAFTSMRARGAQVTDIAVLVVAADDGIMPQTIEAINHAKQAKVPIIVAVNKMDKSSADPDRILQQLTEHEVLPEEWGGDTPVVRVSAKSGAGVDDLLSNILTLAEIKELRANPNRNARGTIIEARLDKGLGKIATILVQNGTIHVGDYVVAGVCTGKIRAMIDDKGKYVKKAGPSIPVSVTGWNDVPEAGDLIDVVTNEKFANELAEERRMKLMGGERETEQVSLNDLFDKIKSGELKSVKLIIKADVQGSLEAVKQSLSKLGNEEVTVDIIHGGVGAINEGDVSLADTAKAVIIGFNVLPDINAKQLAAQKKIDVRFYNIIYNAIEDIENAVKGLLEPKFKEVALGNAEVREVFKITGVGAIAGSHVVDGKMLRGAKARLIRDGVVEYTGEIESLRHNKDDVKEMGKNFDCGIMLRNYQDIKQGDIIEAFNLERINEN